MKVRRTTRDGSGLTYGVLDESPTQYITYDVLDESPTYYIVEGDEGGCALALSKADYSPVPETWEAVTGALVPGKDPHGYELCGHQGVLVRVSCVGYRLRLVDAVVAVNGRVCTNPLLIQKVLLLERQS